MAITMFKRRKSDIGPIDGDVGRGVPIPGKRDRRRPTGYDKQHIAGNDTSAFDDEREWSSPRAARGKKK